MCINNTSHLIYPIKRINNGILFWGNTKFTLGTPKIANFNSAKTYEITNSQTLISANISSFTVSKNLKQNAHISQTFCLDFTKTC